MTPDPTVPMGQPRGTPPPAPRGPQVDAARLWAGGAATAAVAALVAVVGVAICEGVLDIDMVRPALLLDLDTSFSVRYAITAAIFALVATGLAHALVLTTPRPRAFFAWIIGLATAAGVALPFAAEGTTEGRLATAAVNLVLGLSILTLLSSVMLRTVRYPRAPGVGPEHVDPRW